MGERLRTGIRACMQICLSQRRKKDPAVPGTSGLVAFLHLNPKPKPLELAYTTSVQL